jgi:hypothetical protein
MTPPTRSCLKIQNNNHSVEICRPSVHKPILDFTITKPDAKLTFNISTGNIFSGNKTNFGGSRR